MTKQKPKRQAEIESDLDETLARLLRTDPEELAATMAAEVAKQREDANRRISDARREIEDGARPRKGRFRL